MRSGAASQPQAISRGDLRIETQKSSWVDANLMVKRGGVSMMPVPFCHVGMACRHSPRRSRPDGASTLKQKMQERVTIRRINGSTGKKQEIESWAHLQAIF